MTPILPPPMILKSLKSLLARYSLSPEKDKGQHFLIHEPSLDAMAQHTEGASAILEIGPGVGCLTRVLPLHLPLSLMEKDDRMEPLLRQEFPHAHVMITDACTADWTPFSGAQVVGNLPYNVSVPLLLRYLRFQELFSGALFMFQREVGLRIIAKPNTKAYGRLAVMAQTYSAPRWVLDVPAGAFWPIPRVQSCVIVFDKRSSLPSFSFSSLERVLGAAFENRRKMLHHNLKSLGLTEHGLDGRLRAEALSVQDFWTLAQAYEEKKCGQPLKTV